MNKGKQCCWGSFWAAFCFATLFAIEVTLGLFCNVLSAQEFYEPKKLNKKAVILYREAMMVLDQGDLSLGNKILHKVVTLDSTFLDAYVSMAGVYGEMKEYQKAVECYEKVYAKDSLYLRKFFLSYSLNLAGTGRFERAYSLLESMTDNNFYDDMMYKSIDYRKKCYAFAMDYATHHPRSNEEFRPINLGDNINSPHSEYFPTMSIDDSLLVFTRREKNAEFFYSAQMHSDGSFSKAAPLKGNLNEELFKGAISVSADGEWMVFAGDIKQKTFGNYDIFLSYNTPEGWSDPINFGDKINTEYWESSPCLSPDKRALYFTSNRPGGMGGADLYVSYRDEKGNWTAAINMGSTINTPQDEQAPFIHYDNQTLYFSSNGLQGYGGSDLFVVRKNANGAWGIPQNLGYPINTIENEGSLTVAPNGVDAYYASDRSDSKGMLDLYKFSLFADMRPSKTVYIKGFVLDAHSKKGLPSNVALISEKTGRLLMLHQTDETGYFFITLPYGEKFLFQVDRKGYCFYSKELYLTDTLLDSAYRNNIYLEPIALNQKIILQNVLFATGKSILLQESTLELDKVVQMLFDNPKMMLAVVGHTDNVGGEAANLLLSEERARAVMQYFLSKGISSNRITTKGLGSSQPIADNGSEEGRRLNRRTELEITGL